MPYLPAPLFEIPLFGGVPIHLFGILVASGVLLGSYIAERQGEKWGLDKFDMRWLSTRTVIGGFVASHLFDVLAYDPARVLRDPWILLSFWAGLSSFGGFLGAAITFAWLTRRERMPALAFADAIGLGLAPAWILGRLGCYSAHDHPGLQTSFFLAVEYPDGLRHDLGLYEAIFTIFLTLGVYQFARARRGPGAMVGFLATAYAPVRFLLDFLRASDVDNPDPRYFGLTPGQWASIVCFAVGVWLLANARGKPPYAPPAPEPSAPDLAPGARSD